MKPFRWSSDKNAVLLADRGLSFEHVVIAVQTGGLLDIVAHPNQDKYPHQRVMVLQIDNYVYLVPFIDEPDHFFLKTAIPSRKATKTYLRRG